MKHPTCYACLFFVLILCSYSCRAGGNLVCVDFREGGTWVEQKVRLYPPINFKNRKIEFIWIRSAIILGPTMPGQKLQIIERKITIYDHFNSKHVLVELSGTTNAKEAIPILPELSGYGYSCLTDYTQKLEHKYIELGNDEVAHEVFQFKGSLLSPGASP